MTCCNDSIIGNEVLRLFEYLHGIYCRKKGETHLDTLALASSWALSLHFLQRHEEAAELQDHPGGRFLIMESMLHDTMTGASILSIPLLLSEWKEITLFSLRDKVGNSHTRCVTEYLAGINPRQKILPKSTVTIGGPVSI